MDEQFTTISGTTTEYLIRLAISIGIGFLIGLERSYSQKKNEEEEEFAGLRTFTLVSVMGFLSALLTTFTGMWLLGVTLGGMIAFVIFSYYRLSAASGGAGGTTEIATILTFMLGVLVFFELILLALAITVVILLLLAFKPSLHLFVKKLSKQELVAIIQFLIISALILPFLPDENFGPYNLWNLKDIWKMVILVSGTSLVGYIIAKIIGNKGTMVAGIVGGLVSSTAVALTFSKQSKQDAGDNGAFYYAIAIISACTIMFPRVLFEVYVINPQLAQQLWLPITVISLTGFGAAFIIYKRHHEQKDNGSVPLKNPLNFGTALKFALFFAGIMLLVRYSSENFGEKGTYIAGAIAGITDVDAITLSMAKAAKNTASSSVAINTILLASLSNTLVKFCIVLALGSSDLLKISFIGFAAIFSAGLGFLLFYLF